MEKGRILYRTRLEDTLFVLSHDLELFTMTVRDLATRQGQRDRTTNSRVESTSTTRRIEQRSPGGRSYDPSHADEEPPMPTAGRRGGRINDHGTKVKRMLYDGRSPSRRSRPWRDNSKKDAKLFFYNKRGDAHDDHDIRQHRRDDRDRRLAYDQDRLHDYDGCHDYNWEN